MPVKTARYESCDQVLQPLQKHVSCAWVDLELSFLSCRCELHHTLLLHKMDTLGTETVCGLDFYSTCFRLYFDYLCYSSFNFLHSLSVCMCVHVLVHVSVCVLNPGAGITDSCEPSDIWAGNQTYVL